MVWCPTTSSMMILSGHGPASPAMVSTSMAPRMMTSHTRYDRARSITRPAMPAPDLFEAEAVDITRDLSHVRLDNLPRRRGVGEAADGTRRATASRLALMVDDLVTLPLEGGYPFVDRRGAKAGMMRITTPTLHAGDLEEVVQLLVGQLDQQAGEKLSAGFADRRVTQRAGKRLAHVCHTRHRVAPDRRVRPFFEVQAPPGIPVAEVRVPERQAHLLTLPD